MWRHHRSELRPPHSLNTVSRGKEMSVMFWQDTISYAMCHINLDHKADIYGRCNSMQSSTSRLIFIDFSGASGNTWNVLFIILVAELVPRCTYLHTLACTLYQGRVQYTRTLARSTSTVLFVWESWLVCIIRRASMCLELCDCFIQSTNDTLARGCTLNH